MRRINILMVSFILILFISCMPTSVSNVDYSQLKNLTNSQDALDKVVAYKCVGSDATYYVFINSDTKWRGFVVGDQLKGAFCIVDSRRAGTDPIINYEGIRFSEDETILYLQPLSSAIFKK